MDKNRPKIPCKGKEAQKKSWKGTPTKTNDPNSWKALLWFAYKATPKFMWTWEDITYIIIIIIIITTHKQRCTHVDEEPQINDWEVTFFSKWSSWWFMTSHLPNFSSVVRQEYHQTNWWKFSLYYIYSVQTLDLTYSYPHACMFPCLSIPSFVCGKLII